MHGLRVTSTPPTAINRPGRQKQAGIESHWFVIRRPAGLFITHPNGSLRDRLLSPTFRPQLNGKQGRRGEWGSRQRPAPPSDMDPSSRLFPANPGERSGPRFFTLASRAGVPLLVGFRGLMCSYWDHRMHTKAIDRLTTSAVLSGRWCIRT